jgi:hypothetical protein
VAIDVEAEELPRARGGPVEVGARPPSEPPRAFGPTTTTRSARAGGGEIGSKTIGRADGERAGGAPGASAAGRRQKKVTNA